MQVDATHHVVCWCDQMSAQRAECDQLQRAKARVEAELGERLTRQAGEMEAWRASVALREQEHAQTLQGGEERMLALTAHVCAGLRMALHYCDDTPSDIV